MGQKLRANRWSRYHGRSAVQLKVDENISRRGVELLKTAGHDVTTVVEQGLQGASDEAVLDAAADEKRVLVTLDRGFGQILPRAETGTPGIVGLECGKQTTQRNLLKRLG